MIKTFISDLKLGKCYSVITSDFFISHVAAQTEGVCQSASLLVTKIQSQVSHSLDEDCENTFYH